MVAFPEKGSIAYVCVTHQDCMGTMRDVVKAEVFLNKNLSVQELGDVASMLLRKVYVEPDELGEEINKRIEREVAQGLRD